MKYIALIPIAAALLLSGCTTSTVGTPISPEQVARIEAGATTKEDLTDIFGPPRSSSIDHQGRVVLVWMFMETGLDYGILSSSATSQMNTLQVILDDKQRVAHFNYTEGGSTAKSNLF